MMLFQRQKQALSLLNSLGGRVENLDFQKLLFLYCRESETPVYEFVPYKYGAFSFTSYADRRKLIEQGYLAADEKIWILTDAGRATAAQQTFADDFQSFADKYQALRGDKLVAETYRRFPYFATRSEIAERVLDGDSVALKQIDLAQPKPKSISVATIGYEGRTLENYLNELLAIGITLLCDVRRNPISRKYGFSKSTLSKGCEGVGIRYEHLPQLGIASEFRKSLETQADYDELFQHYERVDLPKQDTALQKIREWINEGYRIALTCYEREPNQCHRHCVAEALEKKFGQGFSPAHL